MEKRNFQGYKKGYCRDENGEDIKYGEISDPTVETTEDCVDYCMKQSKATACEYNKISSDRKCISHTATIGVHTNGDKNGLCSLILPTGLLLFDNFSSI